MESTVLLKATHTAARLRQVGQNHSKRRILRLFKSTLSLPPRIIVALFGLTMIALTGAGYFSGKKEGPLPVLAIDEIVILRTPGGMLEVTTLVRKEEFRWSTQHTCPLSQ